MTEQPLTDAELEALSEVGVAWCSDQSFERLVAGHRAARKALREIAALPFGWASATSGHARQAIEIARAALPKDEADRD